jgi:glyoxylase I family protein
VLKGIHHIAIICSDYEASKHFYTQILGLQIHKETYREDPDPYKLDLVLNGSYIIEPFSFPNPPKRTSRPEAAGLRHLAFEVDNLKAEVDRLNKLGVKTEPPRSEGRTKKKFTFFTDPDDLPLEIYEG